MRSRSCPLEFVARSTPGRERRIGKRQSPIATFASEATRTPGTPTDGELVAAVRDGDDRAFERLYETYHRRIAAYIYGMVGDYGRAEDIAQDVFMSALRRMRETDRPIAFKPWVYEIAKNACIDQFRRSRRTQEVSIDAEGGLGAADLGRLATKGPGLDAVMDQKQALENLTGAFGGLSETHHQILVMRELEGQSYREIGERLAMSRASVESTLFRARRRLSEEYDELVSGERCRSTQRVIGAAADGRIGARDNRRLARHISHCQPCRRFAHARGLDAGVMARRPVRSKIAAFLPLPAFLRERWLPGRPSDGSTSQAAGGHAASLANWSATMSAQFEPAAAGWIKSAAAATTIAVAGVGAGAVSDVRYDADAPRALIGSVFGGEGSSAASVPVARREPGTLSLRSPAAVRTGAKPLTASPGTGGRQGTPGTSVAGPTGGEPKKASPPPGAGVLPALPAAPAPLATQSATPAPAPSGAAPSAPGVQVPALISSSPALPGAGTTPTLPDLRAPAAPAAPGVGDPG